MKKYCAAMVALVGCTPVHLGEVSELGEGKVAVDCVRDDDFDTPAYKAVVCTFENRSDALLRTKVTQIAFSSADPRVIDADELAAVGEAYGNKIERQAQAERFWVPILAGVAAGAAVHGLSRASGSSPGVAAAEGTSAGIGVGLHTALHRDRFDERWDGARYEAHHLLGGAFSIPARMDLKRYAVVQLPENAPWPETMTLTLEEPRAETVKVKLWRKSDRH
jgi:hypothetical protein